MSLVFNSKYGAINVIVHKQKRKTVKMLFKYNEKQENYEIHFYSYNTNDTLISKYLVKYGGNPAASE